VPADGKRVRAVLQDLPAVGQDAATRREIPVKFN
jgi:hypothetical protein